MSLFCDWKVYSMSGGLVYKQEFAHNFNLFSKFATFRLEITNCQLELIALL